MYIKAQAFSILDWFLFNWNSLVLDKDSWFFIRWVSGLTITICNKITVSDYLFILKALYQPFSYTVYLSCLIIKARLKICFFHSSARKIHLSTCRIVTKISSCRVNTTSRQGIKRLGISFGSIFLLFSNKSSRGPLS